MRDGRRRPSLINRIIPLLLFDQNEDACHCRKLQALIVLKIDTTHTDFTFFSCKPGRLAACMMLDETIGLKMACVMMKRHLGSLEVG